MVNSDDADPGAFGIGVPPYFEHQNNCSTAVGTDTQKFQFAPSNV